MAEVKWNDEQIQAINTREGAILVSAAAGSGKTAVLVERVIQMLTDKEADIRADQLLIVTFTNLAADEMKTRINKRIDKLLDECSSNPNLDENYLRNQKLLLDKAHISTIDSFCKDIVTTEYTRFNISPDYRIGDTAELKAIQYGAIEQTAEEYYQRDDFREIAELFTTTNSDNTLKTAIINLYNFLSALPFPEKWLEQTIQNLENSLYDVLNSVWIQNILEDIKRDIEYAKGIMYNNTKIHMALDNSDDIILSCPKRNEQIKLEYEFIEELSKCKSWNDLQNFSKKIPSSALFVKLVSKRNLSDEGKELNKSYRDNREILQNTVKSISEKVSLSEEDLQNQLIDVIRVSKVLFEFVNDFTKLYSEMKREKNILDFADLERFTLLTLAEVDENGEFFVDEAENFVRYNITERAKELSANFKQVIVDEYQDVNQLQDIIFRIISNNNKNLFVVGDVKQSIYGFRQAMPDIFIGRRKDYNKKSDNIAQNIILKRNYRSRDGVTDFVNFVFAHLMKKEIGNLEYEAEDFLVAGAKYIGENESDIYVHLNNLPERNSKLSEKLEAKKIADIIKNSVNIYNITDGDITRKATYKDIAILMRSVKNTSILTNYLEQCGIPVITETKASLLDCKEVKIIIDLLRVIDNPMQDIPLYSVLVSPMFGFTPQQIAQIRCKNGIKKFLYSNVIMESNVDNRLKSFVEDIEYYREIAANNPTDELINIIYRKTAITEYVNALENGEVILNNLRMLYNCSKNFEDEQNKGVSSFIRYIDKARESDASLDTQTGANTDGNAVRIMTIHHSKGLEFPICILANIGKQPVNFTDKLYFDRKLGIGLKLKDTNSSAIYKTFPYMAIVNKMKIDDVAEELRVLYVALTRAREQLHIIGSVPKLYERISKISGEIAMYKGINSNIVINHNYMIDWIIAVLLMMKSKNNNQNILWDYANILFREEIAFNPKINFMEHKQVVIDINNFEEEQNKVEEVISEITEKEYFIPYGKRKLDINILNNRFNSKYKYQSSVNVPSVVTPSSVAHKKLNILNRFSFEQKDSLNAAQRGTVMHRFMENANLKEALISPQAEIKRLLDDGYLSKKQAECISASYIKRCLNTELMQRYLKSPKTYKELKFEAMVEASLTGFPDCKEEHLLRGAVDCAFEENGELVIIDYKTDYVENMEELKERYSEQLNLYKIGLSATLNKVVKQCYIYSFRLNNFILC